MKIYSLGPDNLEDYELTQITEDQFEWLVYSYENYGYEGGGDAVALGKDGSLYYSSLSHCSCYGPTESWPDKKMSIEEFLRDKDNVHDYHFMEEVDKKVRALLKKM